jgi:hypothetical protein
VQLPLLTVVRAARFAVALAAGLGAGSDVVFAQETRTVHASMVFQAEGGPLQTTACLQLTERVYPASRWWETSPGEGSAPDRAFKAVFAAIKAKDRAALLKLTEPAQARDTPQFDRQASAFFAQFQSIQLVALPRAYEFDGLVVFFGTFKSEDQTAVVPLVFAREGEERFGFLPSRAKGVTFTLVSEWFTASAGPGRETPAYCDEPAVKRATHRVALRGSSWRPSLLLLTGASLDAPGSLSDVAARVKSTIERMKAALRGPDVSAFFTHMTPEGAGQLKPWLETAPAVETGAYKTAFIGQQPFFVFDESPLVVVYTKTASGQIQVLYFTATADKRLLWTNSAYITVADQVFKQGPLLTAAATAQPFSGLALK